MVINNDDDDVDDDDDDEHDDDDRDDDGCRKMNVQVPKRQLPLSTRPLCRCQTNKGISQHQRHIAICRDIGTNDFISFPSTQNFT